ncbi:hypothetical protein IFM89_013549 [Coptis chinensis]|uniref:2-isopropylmalate synthase n=1 Tax=Coptis chinensis TaxID=261450 RepID=A0A835LZU9_9MAGN|nr:hypothetical protein IFM89_013549 [Coptis chinensis]
MGISTHGVAAIRVLRQVVMAIRCHGEELLGGLRTGINTRHIVMASKMVVEFTGLQVQPHKAIVGANAFAHESGIHQTNLTDGRHALRSRLLELGYELMAELDVVFWRFKAVAEKKKHLSDGDIEALISDEIFQPQAIWSLGDLQVICGTLGLSTATVKLIGIDGEEHICCSVGTGPVDAAYRAIDQIVKESVTLLEYSINSVTEGIDAIASTSVLIAGENGHSCYYWTNRSSDIQVLKVYVSLLLFPSYIYVFYSIFRI